MRNTQVHASTDTHARAHTHTPCITFPGGRPLKKLAFCPTPYIFSNVMLITRPAALVDVRGMVLIQMFSPLPHLQLCVLHLQLHARARTHQPPHSAPLAFASPGHWRVPLMKICWGL